MTRYKDDEIRQVHIRINKIDKELRDEIKAYHAIIHHMAKRILDLEDKLKITTS